MKAIFYSISYILIIVSLLSCNKESNTENVILSIEKTSYQLDNKSSDFSISFITNNNWNVRSDASWCKVYPSSGVVESNNYAVFSVSIETNQTFNKRDCNIFVSADSKTIPITISQDSSYGFSFEKDDFSLENGTNNITLSFETNVSYSIHSSCTWIQLSEFSGDKGKHSINVAILANETNNVREGNIVFSSTEKPISKTIHIRQSAASICKDVANCYIVKPNSNFSFKAFKGNRNISISDIHSVQILWESFGTNEKPNENDIIVSAKLDNTNISITTKKEGNALIAACNSNGKILWSWHIWVTDYDPNSEYDSYNNSGILMNRNLGSLSNTPGSIKAFGLLYQWGRKDPFLGSCSHTEDTYASSTLDWPKSVTLDKGVDAISYSIENPTTYIQSPGNNTGDWVYGHDSSLWNEEKSIYDPCPPGWKTPSIKFFQLAGFERKNYETQKMYDKANHGCLLSSKYVIPNSWFPCTGGMSYQAVLSGSSRYNGIWCCTNDGGAYSYDFYFDLQYSSGFVINPTAYRGDARSIRCSKE